MSAQSKYFISILMVLNALSSTGCEREAAGENAPSASADAGFSATVTGAVEGRVSGGGVLHFIESGRHDGEGYYFLADGRGLRDYGVTFTLPAGVRTGRHALKSPHPLDAGSVPSVRVDHDDGDNTLSWEQNTTGALNLSTFPQDGVGLVEGDFEFQTENANGEIVRVRGSFSFTAELGTTRVPSSLRE